MIALKLIWFTVLFIIVDCREFGRFIGRGNVRHRQLVEEYTYNHPPASENYEAIPVAVVYEDEGSRKDKSVISDIPETSKVQQVTQRGKPNVTIKPNVTREDSSKNIDLNQNKAEIKEEYTLKPTEQPTVEAEKEHQIPVAVFYEPESSYYKEARTTGHRLVTKRRKVQRPAAEEARVTPSAEEKRTTAVVEEKQTAPGAEEKRTTAVVEEKRTAVVAEIKQIGPVAEQEQVTPAVEDERVDLAAEVKQGGLTAEKVVVAPVAEKRRVVPAVQEKRVVVKEAIDVDNQQNAYDSKTSTQKIRDNSESKQTQQFPKRDSSSVRRKDVVPIVQSENLVFSHSGDFQYSYEGGDGTKAFEKGQLKTYPDDNAGEAVSGGFSYTAKDGNEYSLTYTADENGYRPMGAHLPTPPPIPPAIARALAYLATKTTAEPVTDSIKESDTDY